MKNFDVPSLMKVHAVRCRNFVPLPESGRSAVDVSSLRSRNRTLFLIVLYKLSYDVPYLTLPGNILLPPASNAILAKSNIYPGLPVEDIIRVQIELL